MSMGNWTVEDLKSYAMRRLRNEQAARTEMQSAADSARERVSSYSKDKRQKLLDHAKKQIAVKPKAQRSGYSLPVVLAFFAECGLPEPVPEFRFHPERLWRFDFCFVEQRLAIEVNGGLFSSGAHVRGAALIREYGKLNQAAVMGFRVMFFTPDQICLVETSELIRQALFTEKQKSC